MFAMRAGIGFFAVVLIAAVGACGDGTKSDDAGVPTVVASTDVWGSVARAIAGDHAKVTSIITGAAADPHSFEASPADATAIIDATLVVYNGGGYDQWVDDILTSHPGVASIDAYALRNAAAPDDPASASTGPPNEHVFYDLDTAKAVAATVADRLAGDDPGHIADYQSNAQTFSREADVVGQIEKSIRTMHPGATIVATEPVAHYLVTAADLTDKTPPGFTSAVEQDTDPAPVDVAAMLDLISGRQVDAVLINPQTATAVTKKIRAAADSAGVPIVTITETLPAGTDYLAWQRDTASRLAAALQQN